MNLILILLIAVCVIGIYFLSIFLMRLRLNRQIKKMLQVMRADETLLNQPPDAFEESDPLFVDLERSAFSLRRKYLNLKKRSIDERAAFETVFSGLNEGIVTIDENLKIISFNTRFIEIFRWVPQSLTNENRVMFLQDVVRDPEIIKHFKAVFAGKPVLREEVNSLQLSINLLPAGDSKQPWALGVFYDFSEQKNLEKIKIDLVANASHELRTPLTIIRGFSELLNQEIIKKHPELKTYIAPILDGVHTMNDLTDDMLSLAKLEQKEKIEKEFINTQEITELIIQELESLIAINDKVIICHYDASTVFADEFGLRQVIRNLIVNAIRHSGALATEIRISWVLDRNNVLFKVQDFGQGIPPEQIDRIFERFYRVDRGRNRNQGGSGLGLAMVKHQMLKYGGEVTVQSELNRGTEFTCQFAN